MYAWDGRSVAGPLAGRKEPSAHMLAAMLKFLLQEYRKHPMARFAVWMLAYGAALKVVSLTAGSVPALLWVLFWAGVIAVGLYYLARLVGFVRHRVLWRLRRRLIVTYIFIGVVPILLIVLLVLLKDFMTGGQFAAFLVAMKLRGRADELQQLTRAVAHEAHQSRESSAGKMLDRLQNLYLTELSEHAQSYPGLEVTLRIGPQTRAFRLDGKPLSRPMTVPAWLAGEEFAGFVVDGDEIALRAVNRGPTSAGELALILSQPLTPELLDLVGEGVGPVGVLVPRGAATPAGFKPQGVPALPGGPEMESRQTRTIRSKSVEVPVPISRFDSTVFGASTLDLVVWGGETKQYLTESVFVFVTSRMGTLATQLLETLGRFSRIYVTAFFVVAIVFLVIEIFSLVISVQLTRSMTTTVDRLYAATERVKTGDLTYRINLPARDQLSALGEAFDSMTASIERLLKESQEKLRLQSEIEIAQEVQRQLFPQVAPHVPGLQVYGFCKPARAVSGDYYDFLRLGDNRIGLALVDVSGKGISAALLMATIQSALHAQLYNGYLPGGVPDVSPITTAALVARLNHQLFENTPMEKYATLFYAVYDTGTRKLTYTNAGHLPPILLRRGEISRLRAGGPVVGLFSQLRYEQAEVQLEPEDLLLAFTDGFTEPENSFGEEFGEARLVEAARRALGAPLEVLVEEICRSVADWTGSPELQDDMTLLVAKAQT